MSSKKTYTMSYILKRAISKHKPQKNSNKKNEKIKEGRTRPKIHFDEYQDKKQEASRFSRLFGDVFLFPPCKEISFFAFLNKIKKIADICL